MSDIFVNSYEQFVVTVFDPPLEGTYGTPWYDDANIELTDEACAEYYIRLFEAPEFLLDTFNHRQLEDGFHSMIDCNFPIAVSELVWEERLPIERRERVIAAMVPLFQRFFAVKAFWYSTNMWWDSIAYAFCCGNAIRGRSENETRLQDAMFAALRIILWIPTEECQRAALHGLGHLRHPETQPLIREYLAANPHLLEGDREYALAAARGDVQ